MVNTTDWESNLVVTGLKCYLNPILKVPNTPVPSILDGFAAMGCLRE